MHLRVDLIRVVSVTTPGLSPACVTNTPDSVLARKTSPEGNVIDVLFLISDSELMDANVR